MLIGRPNTFKKIFRDAYTISEGKTILELIKRRLSEKLFVAKLWVEVPEEDNSNKKKPRPAYAHPLYQ